MTRAIDTSVIMAILLEERGGDVAARLAPGGLLSSVNFAEILTKCVERSLSPHIADDYIRGSGIDIVGFDAEMAVLSADLFRVARKGLLSLGDRACIATAARMNATVVTADRVWAELDLPCPVELIR